jgi:hypothetical protein
MAAKFFTGLPLDGPDPECVKGNADAALLAVAAGSAPKPSLDHSHRTARRPVPVTLGLRPTVAPVSACNDNPLAGLAL